MVRVMRVLAASVVAVGLVTPSALPAVAAHHHDRAPTHARAGISVDRLRQPQFVSTTRGYALVFHGDRREAGLALTLDGGRRWTALHHPSFDAASSRPISADALSLTVTRHRLLVWGPTGLFTARQNGSRWHRAIVDRVGQVAAVGSSAWATSWACEVGTRCRGWLQVSRDFGRTWSGRAPLPRGVGPRSGVTRLVRDDRRTAYLVRPELGRNGALAVTTDGGLSWSSRPLPHRTEHEFIGFMPLAVDAAGGLWLTIPGEPGAGNEVKAVYRSDDEGRSWTRVAITSPPAHRGRSNLSTVGYVANLVAGSADTAYLLLHRAPPLATTTGGRQWDWVFSAHHIPHHTDFTDVWFDSIGGSRAWFWTNGSHHLWATRDGGRHWAPVANQPMTTPRTARWCRTSDLRARVQTFGSVMSQPFMDIALRNAGATACALRGYASLDAFGAHSGAANHRLDVDVRHRDSYERADPGPHRVVLRPLQRALLSIGTAAAYQGGAHLFEIDRLSLRIPHTGGPITLSGLQLYASAPRHRPIPVSLTAVYAGRPHVA
jgi:photosystem II stability/assembly factor-like uncharacterized protein